MASSQKRLVPVPVNPRPRGTLDRAILAIRALSTSSSGPCSTFEEIFAFIRSEFGVKNNGIQERHLRDALKSGVDRRVLVENPDYAVAGELTYDTDRHEYVRPAWLDDEGGTAGASAASSSSSASAPQVVTGRKRARPWSKDEVGSDTSTTPRWPRLIISRPRTLFRATSSSPQ